MPKPKFECPDCGDNSIEEIVHGGNQTSLVTDIEEDGGELSYGKTSYNGGEIDRYQCVSCGYIIEDAEDGAELLIALENLEEERRKEVLG